MMKFKNWTIETSTAATVAEGMKTLPVYQTIRGSKQWSKDKRDALIEDVRNGLYVPPIVYAWETDGEGERRLVIVDGQQRGAAIAEGVADGVLAPDTPVLIAIDNRRDGADCFRVLNVGVPVGSALVTAVSLDGAAGKALLAVAEHRALDLVPWSAIQTGRTERAAFAATLLAVAAGWSMPESSTKVCEAWLKEHSTEINDETRTAALSIAERIAAALSGHADIVGGTDKARAKVARKVLAGVRRKNNWLTLCQLVNDDYSAEDAVALFADGVAWSKRATYQPTRLDGKGRKRDTATIPMGGGSSGNHIDTAARLDAAKYYLTDGGDYVRDPYAEINADDKTERRAAEKVANIDGDALKAALGA